MCACRDEIAPEGARLLHECHVVTSFLGYPCGFHTCYSTSYDYDFLGLFGFHGLRFTLISDFRIDSAAYPSITEESPDTSLVTSYASADFVCSALGDQFRIVWVGNSLSANDRSIDDAVGDGFFADVRVGHASAAEHRDGNGLLDLCRQVEHESGWDIRRRHGIIECIKRASINREGIVAV